MLKDVDTSPVVTAKVSAHGITLTRQSLDERSSAYLCYDRVTSVIEGQTVDLYNKIMYTLRVNNNRVSKCFL